MALAVRQQRVAARRLRTEIHSRSGRSAPPRVPLPAPASSTPPTDRPARRDRHPPAGPCRRAPAPSGATAPCPALQPRHRSCPSRLLPSRQAQQIRRDPQLHRCSDSPAPGVALEASGDRVARRALEAGYPIDRLDGSADRPASEPDRHVRESGQRYGEPSGHRCGQRIDAHVPGVDHVDVPID